MLWLDGSRNIGCYYRYYRMGATLHFNLFVGRPQSWNGPKNPCPNRRPVELSDGLEFKPFDILPKLGLTAVSRECQILKSQTLFRGRRDFLKGALYNFAGRGLRPRLGRKCSHVAVSLGNNVTLRGQSARPNGIPHAMFR